MVLELVIDAVSNRIAQTAKVVDEVRFGANPYRHQALATDEDDDFEEAENRPIPALCCPPQDLTFDIPESVQIGDMICIQGPHGPLPIKVLEGMVPGERCMYRLGGPDEFIVDVPEGGLPGDNVSFPGRNGEELQAVIPLGCKPGDSFRVGASVIMVQVPMGARAGRAVSIKMPYDKQPKIVRVPEGCTPGMYFCVPLVPPNLDGKPQESLQEQKIERNSCKARKQNKKKPCYRK